MRCGLGAVAGVTLMAALCGCEATHVLYVHDTVLGLDFAPVAEDSARFTFGFDRQVFSIVPCFEEKKAATIVDGKQTAPESTSMEAASVAAFSRVTANGISDLTFHHLVATGAPAQDIAKDPELLRQLRQSIVDKGAPAKGEQKPADGSKQ